MNARRILWVSLVFAAVAAGLGAADKKSVAKEPAPLSKVYSAMEFRAIGPYRGGRVTAVSGVRGRPHVFYLGATGGGVWQTVDGGSNWRPISDKDFHTGSIGAIAVAESDPNVIYVGTGESPIRGNVSNGDGVYKSSDGGKTWINVGLGDSQQISRVRIHPRNPDLVYVAAQGHVWGPNPMRGVYRSGDGGKTWDRVLFVSDKTGASDLAMDPENPRILYAAFWQVHRKPWTLESGGTEGGIWKSADGGDTWKKLAGGLPEGIVGNIGVAVSGSRHDRLWAIVESKDKGGVYRSDDGGEKWTRTNSENKLRQRAWYYTRIYADSKNADAVYVLNTGFFRSGDAGKTFQPIKVPHGDNHDLWIDPDDPERMIESNDGGANVTFNGGATWSSIMNQPTAQIYRVATDDRFPYWIYGAQQDNSTVAIASRGRDGSIGVNDWYAVGGCESGWIAPKPGNPDVSFAGCYGGSIQRDDHKTGETREVVAWPQLAIGQAAKDLKYRFQWNAPILISPHAPDTLYHASQVLLMSRDEGQTWTEISPDLTRNDKAKQEKSGGPITHDDTGIEVYDTIFYVAESPHEAGVIWVGTDDGLVQLTRDGGKTWQNVTPKGLPEWIRVNAIEVSPHDKATCYLAATMYQFDDFRPYLYKTNDYGKTWTKIVHGIPDSVFTRVIREDPTRRGLLYAGTEYGLYVSLDDGANWQSFQLNLPATPVTDLAVKNTDLVVATQGRAFWILDDLTPLHQYRDTIRSEGLRVFTPRPTARFPGGGGPDDEEGSAAPVGKNPPDGVLVYYWLKEKPKETQKLTVEFLAGDKVLRRYSSEKKEKPEGEEKESRDREDKPLELKDGLNRIVWDMRIVKPTLLPKAVIWGSHEGPKVAPGSYSVRVTLGDDVVSQPFEVRPNPGVGASVEDLKKQFALLAEARDGLSQCHEAVIQIRDVKAQIDAMVKRAEKLGRKKDVIEKAKALTEKLTAVEKKVVNPDVKSNQDVLNFAPALDHQFAGLASVVGSADAKPTAASETYYKQIRGQLDAILAERDAVFSKDLAEFNKAVRAEDIAPVMVVSPKED